jgi:hypothetical protein
MKKDNQSDPMVYILQVLVAAVLLIFAVLASKVIWPLTQYLAKKSWTMLKNRLVRTKVVQEKKVEELPTPDIFKGAQNLARAREMSF